MSITGADYVTDTQLFQTGIERFDLASHLSVDLDGADYRALRSAYDDLPEDPYAKGSGRYRRYARGMLLPWTKEFSWIPATPGQSREGMCGYYQGDHNPEYVGMTRNLAAISEDIYSNKILLDIIRFDFERTRWNDTDAVWPVHVGVHLIKLSVAADGGEAFSSPNEVHQDGEPFVFTHLVYRRNAEGGENIFAPPAYRGKQPADVPPGDRIAEFTLTRPLESYGVRDVLVSHYVAPIRKGPGQEPGERAVILTDFVPMRQRI
jgi:hypothetical protein